MEATTFWISFLGLWCGIIARITIPYLRKVYQGTVTGWDHRYTFSMIAGAILTFIIAVLSINQLTIPEPPVEGVTPEFLFQVWTANFIVGYGLISIINEILSAGKPKASEA